MKRTALLISLALGFLVVMLFATSYRRASAASDAKAGRQVHVSNCQRCHGPQGKGDGPAGALLKVKPANWTDKGRMGKLSDADLFKVIKFGGPSIGKSPLMPAWKSKLSDGQIQDVIAFIRSL